MSMIKMINWMSTGIALALLAAGCGEKKEKVTEKATEKASTLMEHADELKAKANELKGQATTKLLDLAGVASRVKGEIEKVYKATGLYDVEVSAEAFPDEGMKEHEAKLAAMPNVKLGDLTIGYEEMGEKSLNGTTFERHFRATWVEHGMKIGLSYYTKEQLDLPAFAALIVKFVPIVQAQLGFAG